MTSTRLRIGVVGAGFMGGVHSRAARAAGAELAAVVTSDPAGAAEAASALGFVRSHRTLEDLLADDSIDVVHICTPNALHAAQASAVLAAGKSVICEKPLATTLTDATSLTEAASRSAGTATVPFVYRFHPMVREARARVAAGQVGAILSISGSYLQDWLLGAGTGNWRVDRAEGGRSRAFADIGSHLLDLVEFVTAERIVGILARTRTAFPHRSGHENVTTEDIVAAVVQTESGAIGTLLVSQVAAGRKNQLLLEIAGEKENIAFNQERPDDLWIGRSAGAQLLARGADHLHADAARFCTVPAGHPQGYQDAFNGFVAESYRDVQGLATSGLPRFADGLRAVRVTEAVLESARTGEWVRLVPDAQPARSTA